MAETATEKVVLVTGGSRGIGASIVRRLAADGARVFFTYNASADRANALISELGGAARVEAVKADISKAEDVEALIKHVSEAAGRIDVLVNNAGITRDTLLMRMSEEDWDAVLTTNLKGAFLMCKAVSRPMMRQRSGRIINIGSIVGLAGNAGQVNYSASKAGLVGLTKSLAKELASRNILVNCIAPGYVQTDMTDKLGEKQIADLTNSIPLRRSAQAEEIAGVVAFFASDDASYLTGQVLNADGGLAL